MSHEMVNPETVTYFDHNATTPLDPRVCETMLPWIGTFHGNPSSAHRLGRAARAAVEVAREQVAALVGARSEEIVFTASGSEANNAVVAACAAVAGHRGHLVTSALEHPSVRLAAEQAAAGGMELTELIPGHDGRIDPEAVAGALRPDTRLVCLMLANNELGTVQPVAEVAGLCLEHGVGVLCDAAQAVGKLEVDVNALGVDYLTFGGHKFHAPLGAAALRIRPGAPFVPLLLGAPQEGGRRAGTEDVAAIVGLGKASELARLELGERRRRLGELRERFETGLARLPGTIVHCAGSPRLPHTCHVAFEGLIGHELMLRLDARGYAVSTGAACHSGCPQPSRTLLAMGVSAAESLASLRVSFGITNTPEEIDAFLAVLAEEVGKLREVFSERV